MGVELLKYERNGEERGEKSAFEEAKPVVTARRVELDPPFKTRRNDTMTGLTSLRHLSSLSLSLHTPQNHRAPTSTSSELLTEPSSHPRHAQRNSLLPQRSWSLLTMRSLRPLLLLLLLRMFGVGSVDGLGGSEGGVSTSC